MSLIPQFHTELQEVNCMDNEKRKEIRRILSGFMEDDGKVLTAAESVLTSGFKSVFSGSFSARVLGIAVIKRQYKADFSASELPERCRKAFADMGRRVSLKTEPEGADAVLVFRFLFNPCLITAQFEGSRVLLTFYAARSIAVLLNACFNFSRWLKKMPDGKMKREDITIGAEKDDETPKKHPKRERKHKKK